ncbi:hypothetical protein LOC67_09385 [Stieleria sp. JC731]|uniref:hypothetical protein n=1 Tax=Pirellulaceae TaxID=2691357 RepID=UPI001E507E59|nr:hypothetical protein [Stieleria sp. JC731]MCC9600776.1 hypothetical protein [Stieleria sp. JC731]
MEIESLQKSAAMLESILLDCSRPHDSFYQSVSETAASVQQAGGPSSSFAQAIAWMNELQSDIESVIAVIRKDPDDLANRLAKLLKKVELVACDRFWEASLLEEAFNAQLKGGAEKTAGDFFAHAGEALRQLRPDLIDMLSEVRAEIEMSTEDGKPLGVSLYDAAYYFAGNETDATALVKRWSDSSRQNPPVIGKCPEDGRRKLSEVVGVVRFTDANMRLSAAEKAALYKHLLKKRRAGL